MSSAHVGDILPPSAALGDYTAYVTIRIGDRQSQFGLTRWTEQDQTSSRQLTSGAKERRWERTQGYLDARDVPDEVWERVWEKHEEVFPAD